METNALSCIFLWGIAGTAFISFFSTLIFSIVKNKRKGDRPFLSIDEAKKYRKEAQDNQPMNERIFKTIDHHDVIKQGIDTMKGDKYYFEIRDDI